MPSAFEGVGGLRGQEQEAKNENGDSETRPARKSEPSRPDTCGFRVLRQGSGNRRDLPPTIWT